MSAIDPAALRALVNEAKDALLQATLDLGVPAEVLQARIHVGDLLAARVLPPENGQDFIELAGQRVSAQLPPGVRPGETLVLQVTGFSADQIVVRNLGVQNPQNPVPVSDVRFAPVPARPPQSPPAPPPARAAAPHIAPGREVFVAATVRAPSAAPPAAPPPVSAAARGIVRTIGDLLKSVKFPDTALTRTVAAIAPQAPARLPAVLLRLEAALPRESGDARIATLKTLIAFTARLDPKNVETLPAQIEAYVSHVVEGGEAKLQQLLQALAQTTPEQTRAAPETLPQAPQSAQAPPPPQSAQATVVPAKQQANQAPPQPTTTSVTPPQPPVISQARAAERSAAIDHDLKSVVLSLLRDPSAVRTPALMQALNETFITLTATQLNTLSTNTQTPGTIAFSLPVFFHEGGKPVQLRISREGESASSKQDAENFRVAFVLDTAHMGTVAIDLQSSGRSVKIDVKTQQQSAATRFSDTLGELRDRLERLRYRVASAGASVLQTGRRENAAPRAAGNGLDLRA